MSAGCPQDTNSQALISSHAEPTYGRSISDLHINGSHAAWPKHARRHVLSIIFCQFEFSFLRRRSRRLPPSPTSPAVEVLGRFAGAPRARRGVGGRALERSRVTANRAAGNRPKSRAPSGRSPVVYHVSVISKPENATTGAGVRSAASPRCTTLLRRSLTSRIRDPSKCPTSDVRGSEHTSRDSLLRRALALGVVLRCGRSRRSHRHTHTSYRAHYRACRPRSVSDSASDRADNDTPDTPLVSAATGMTCDTPAVCP